MPWRPMTREQGWLLPPALGDLLPENHPARYVAAFVDGLDETAWAELGIGLDGEPLGAPAYAWGDSLRRAPLLAMRMIPVVDPAG